MKKMAIDLMLQWAYGGELLKNPSLLGEGVGAAIYGADGFAAITKFGKYGCFIDGGGEFPWMPDIEGPAAPGCTSPGCRCSIPRQLFNRMGRKQNISDGPYCRDHP